MKIPWMTLTLCQQGGIGYPPSIVKLDRWYAVEGSREQKPPAEIEPFLEYQHCYPTQSPHFHAQGWVMRRWENAPRLTWDEVIKWAVEHSLQPTEEHGG